MSFKINLLIGIETVTLGEFTYNDKVSKIKQHYYDTINNTRPLSQIHFHYMGHTLTNDKTIGFYEDDVDPRFGMIINVSFRAQDGVFGGGNNEFKDDAKDDIKDEVFKPKVTYEYKNICDHLASISDVKPTKLSNQMKKEFNKYKDYAKAMNKPLVILNNNNNNTNYNDCGLLNTVGLNTDINTFDKNKFIKDYCRINGLHKSQIKILSIKAGSTVIEIYITNTEHHKIDLNKFRTNQATDATVHAELKKIGAFCTLYSEPSKKPGWENQQTFTDRLIFNAQYNRIYGTGNIKWKGDLKDGRNRGNKPYYCPNGWQKRAVSYKFFTSKDFEKKFNGWPMGYHGTKFACGMSILLSGLIPSVRAKGDDAVWGDGVYITPSIIYAAHSRYARPKKIPKHLKSKYGMKGNWIQFVLQCRINPNAIKTIAKETLCVGNKYKIDPNYDNSELEWVTGDTKIEDPRNPDCQVYIVGVMVRITDKHPYLMDESSWWKCFYDYYSNNYLDKYSNDKSNGIKAKIKLME